MDEEQIESKNDLTNHNREFEIKHEPITISQGFILTSIGNTSVKKSSCYPTIKQEASETNTKSITFDKPENLEESGIFVKSKTDIKPEIIFGISESDSQHLMSVVNIRDPLDITAHAEKYKINIKCSFCPKRFSATLDLKNHLDTEHKVVQSAKNAVHEDKKHLKVAQKMNYKCSICSYLFSQKTSLENHYSRFHDIKKLNTVKCSLCPAIFNSEQFFQRHFKIMHSTLECQFCQKKFVNVVDMNTHLKRVHEGKESNIQKEHLGKVHGVECSICSKVYSSKTDLGKHIANVHGNKCKFCPELVKDTIMNEHIALLHAIKCGYCPEKFANNAVMKAHVKSVHEIKCQICPAIFLTNEKLDQHMKKSHTKRKNEPVHKTKCPFCSAIFSSNKEWLEHKNLIHNLNYPIKKLKRSS